jgi:hypothetical protein
MQNQQKAKPAVVVVPDLLVATVTSQLLVVDALSSDFPLLCLAFLAVFLFFSLIPLTEHLPPFFLFVSPFLSRFLPVIYIFLFSCTLGVLMGNQSLYILGSGRAKDIWKRGGIDLCFSLNICIVSFPHLACHISGLPYSSAIVCIHERIAYSFLVDILLVDYMSNQCLKDRHKSV